MKRRKVPKRVVTGTQCIDRYWQSLQKFLPSSVNSQAGRGQGVNRRLLQYIFSIVWRSALKDDCELIQELSERSQLYAEKSLRL